jgi:lysozyme family protein
MKDNWDECFAIMLKQEGGYTDDPHDRGNRLPDGRMGATNFGITQINWEKWVGHQVTKDDMKALTISDVQPVYKKWYWDKVFGDDLPYGVDLSVFDFGVNAGVSRSVIRLQQIVGTIPDGVMGPKTLAATLNTNTRDIIERFSELRESYYRGLGDFDRYGKGWINRTKEVEKISLMMVK